MTHASIFLVLSNWCEGREQDFHAWYETHVEDVLAAPGWYSAQRYRLAGTGEGLDGAWRHLALYEISDDIGAAFAALDETTAMMGASAGPHDGIVEPGYAGWAYAPDGPTLVIDPSVARGAGNAVCLAFFTLGDGEQDRFTEFYEAQLPNLQRTSGFLSNRRYRFSPRPKAHGQAPARWSHLLAYELDGPVDAPDLERSPRTMLREIEKVDPGYALWAFEPIGPPNLNLNLGPTPPWR